ncbi:MAG: thiamine pyrophosphate-binding protein [Cyanobacteriota bacterium]
MPAPAIPLLERNLRASITLLLRLQRRGLRHLVLAPGSRSAPLAVAAALLEAEGLLQLHPGLDERSGAFLALGLARTDGRPAAVVTTS